MSLLQRFIDLLLPATPADKPRRSEGEQARVTAECARLTLYHFQSCPFCLKVRRAIARLDLPIEERDIRRFPQFQDELIAGGGKGQVPCLRIEEEGGGVRWLYESNDIVDYLKRQFDSAG